MIKLTSALVATAVFAVVACASSASPDSGPVTAAAVNLKKLPLGDGHVGTTAKRGTVDSCQTQFGSNMGAQVVGPWIDTSAGTWNSVTKPHIQGSVTWADAAFTDKVSGSTRTIVTKSLPIGGLTTGTFPVAASDPAHQYDANPNTISAQSLTLKLKAKPKRASKPTCLSGGVIGVMVDGVALFDALDAEGRDAAAHEVLDSCDGHPQMSGVYHHHSVTSCLLARAKGRSTLMGYALDGFGIYVERDSSGRQLTNADLDACHGRTSTVKWNGRKQRIYHYVATSEYPYTLGCYRGTPVTTSLGGEGGGAGGGARARALRVSAACAS